MSNLNIFKGQATHFKTDNTKVDVWLVEETDGRYSFLFECCEDKDEKSSRLYKSRTIHMMMYDFHWFVKYMKSDTEENIYIKHITDVKTPSELQFNPFYKYALDTGDEVFQLKLKLYFKLATNDECERYSKMIGKRILPTLPVDYDREYSVFATEVDEDLLSRSGYSLLHVPYFRMRGRTHSMYEINPHKKVCNDSADTEMEGIHFEEFLELFNQE